MLDISKYLEKNQESKELYKDNYRELEKKAEDTSHIISEVTSTKNSMDIATKANETLIKEKLGMEHRIQELIKYEKILTELNSLEDVINYFKAEEKPNSYLYDNYRYTITEYLNQSFREYAIKNNLELINLRFWDLAEDISVDIVSKYIVSPTIVGTGQKRICLNYAQGIPQKNIQLDISNILPESKNELIKEINESDDDYLFIDNKLREKLMTYNEKPTILLNKFLSRAVTAQVLKEFAKRDYRNSIREEWIEKLDRPEFFEQYKKELNLVMQFLEPFGLGIRIKEKK